LLHLGGEVVAALRGVLVEGSLEEVQGLIDLALELFLAELEDWAEFTHVYAYLYGYSKAGKSGRQEPKLRNSMKKKVKELNYYV
jgi:hypothetical protein